jgi:hypothetical protein
LNKLSLCAALAAALGVGCATPAGDAAAPASFETLRARELELPPSEAIAAPDGSFRARPAGRLIADLESQEGLWSGAFDIGSTGPVGCVFYGESVDASTMLRLLADGYFAEIAKLRELGERRVLSVDAGNFGRTPFLALDWAAVIDGAAYQVKLKFANKGDRAIYCAHDETGYERAFEDFFRGLVESYSDGGESEPADFREISLVSVGEMTVGYQVTEVRKDSDGDFRIDVIGSTLIPTGPDTVNSSDDYFVEFARPDGSLINQVVASSDGTSLTRLELERGDAAWTVAGEMQGKPVEASFESESPLLSSLGEVRLLARIAKQELVGDVSYPRWVGPVNPTTVTTHVARSSGGSSVDVQAGPIAMTVDVDDLGMASATIRMGRLEMNFERVYAEGQP